MNIFESMILLIKRLFGKNEVLSASDQEVLERYDFIHRAMSQDSGTMDINQAKILEELEYLINHDLTELARQGSPDNIADILQNLQTQLIQLRQFCEFPNIKSKSIVAVGGKFSAGKSSFINTLLGKKTLVVEIDPTTSIPTYLLNGQQLQITALNIFNNKVEMSEEEFHSLTHEEKAKYGTQVGSLLQTTFITDPDFSWVNLALLDTPGYTKPDEQTYNQRTDADIARSQMNIAHFIIWLVSAEDGGIKDDDLAFLAGLPTESEKLILINKSDRKEPSDIADIVELTKQLLSEKQIKFIDVLPVSRNIKKYPLDNVQNFLNRWNMQPRRVNFTRTFAQLFEDYEQYLITNQQNSKKQVSIMNSLGLHEDEKVADVAVKLSSYHRNSLQKYENTHTAFLAIEREFFESYNQLAQLQSLEIFDIEKKKRLEYDKLIDDILKTIPDNLQFVGHQGHSTRFSTTETMTNAGFNHNLESNVRIVPNEQKQPLGFVKFIKTMIKTVFFTVCLGLVVLFVYEKFFAKEETSYSETTSIQKAEQDNSLSSLVASQPVVASQTVASQPNITIESKNGEINLEEYQQSSPDEPDLQNKIRIHMVHEAFKNASFQDNASDIFREYIIKANVIQEEYMERTGMFCSHELTEHDTLGLGQDPMYPDDLKISIIDDVVVRATHSYGGENTIVDFYTLCEAEHCVIDDVELHGFPTHKSQAHAIITQGCETEN